MTIPRYAGPEEFRKTLREYSSSSPDLIGTVREILETVRNDGDTALREYTKRFDKVHREQIRVTEEDWQEIAEVSRESLELLEEAAGNIRRYHATEFEQFGSWEIEENGAYLGQRVTPLKRVGVYVPGGTAAYPSSVLMNVIPAQVAGVEEIAIVTPPAKDTGKANPLVMATADILGIDEVYVVGGAQAVAALAYGTESVSPVLKITGPGNQYVNEAKRQVFGVVGIESLAGPSEILILVDQTAEPALLAADLLSQAEHDPNARSLLISTDQSLLDKTEDALEEQLRNLPRRDIAAESLSTNGAMIPVSDLMAGIALVNEIGPEHLELMLEEPEEALKEIDSAGAVFLGSQTPEPVGDYWAGSNHILPTGGAARYASALSTRDFVRWTSVVKYSENRLQQNGAQIARFARLEGLEAHARAVDLRLGREEDPGQ